MSGAAATAPSPTRAGAEPPPHPGKAAPGSAAMGPGAAAPPAIHYYDQNGKAPRCGVATGKTARKMSDVTCAACMSAKPIPKAEPETVRESAPPRSTLSTAEKDAARAANVRELAGIPTFACVVLRKPPPPHDLALGWSDALVRTFESLGWMGDESPVMGLIVSTIILGGSIAMAPTLSDDQMRAVYPEFMSAMGAAPGDPEPDNPEP